MAGILDLLANSLQQGSAAPGTGPVPLSQPAQPQDLQQNVDLSNMGRRLTNSQQVNGPFKTHGVVGDILGHLMDMVLVGSGLNPEYSPRVHAAKEADALGDFQNDPQGAVTRLAKIDPVQAMQLQQNTIINQARQAQIKNDTIKNQLELAMAPGKILEQNTKSLTGLQGLAMTANDNNAPTIASRISKLIAQYGLQDFAPTDMSAAGLKAWGEAGIDPGTQLTLAQKATEQAAQLAQGDRRINIEQQNADTNKANVGSEIGNRGVMAGIANRNADTNARNADTNASLAPLKKANIDSQIAARAAKIRPNPDVPPYDPAKYSGHSVPDKAGRGTWVSNGKAWTLNPK